MNEYYEERDAAASSNLYLSAGMTDSVILAENHLA